MSAGLNIVLQLEIEPPTVWFVVGILLSELLRLRCLSVTCLLILFIINLQEGAGVHYMNFALQAAVSHPRASLFLSWKRGSLTAFQPLLTGHFCGFS